MGPPVQQYMQQPPMHPMQSPIQQQPYAAPVYYTDQQAFPDNRQSIAKPYPYDIVTEQSKYGQHQYQNDGTQQSPTPSAGPPLYRPQSNIQTDIEMSGVPDLHHGVAELGQK